MGCGCGYMCDRWWLGADEISADDGVSLDDGASAEDDILEPVDMSAAGDFVAGVLFVFSKLLGSWCAEWKVGGAKEGE